MAETISPPRSVLRDAAGAAVLELEETAAGDVPRLLGLLSNAAGAGAAESPPTVTAVLAGVGFATGDVGTCSDGDLGAVADASGGSAERAGSSGDPDRSSEVGVEAAGAAVEAAGTSSPPRSVLKDLAGAAVLEPEAVAAGGVRRLLELLRTAAGATAEAIGAGGTSDSDEARGTGTCASLSPTSDVLASRGSAWEAGPSGAGSVVPDTSDSAIAFAEAADAAGFCAATGGPWAEEAAVCAGAAESLTTVATVLAGVGAATGDAGACADGELGTVAGTSGGITETEGCPGGPGCTSEVAVEAAGAGVEALAVEAARAVAVMTEVAGTSGLTEMAGTSGGTLAGLTEVAPLLTDVAGISALANTSALGTPPATSLVGGTSALATLAALVETGSSRNWTAAALADRDAAGEGAGDTDDSSAATSSAGILADGGAAATGADAGAGRAATCSEGCASGAASADSTGEVDDTSSSAAISGALTPDPGLLTETAGTSGVAGVALALSEAAGIPPLSALTEVAGTLPLGRGPECPRRALCSAPRLGGSHSMCRTIGGVDVGGTGAADPGRTLSDSASLEAALPWTAIALAGAGEAASCSAEADGNSGGPDRTSEVGIKAVGAGVEAVGVDTAGAGVEAAGVEPAAAWPAAVDRGTFGPTGCRLATSPGDDLGEAAAVCRAAADAAAEVAGA